MDLHRDCDQIAAGAIARVLPGEAVRRALRGRDFGSGRLILAAVGKAAWSMADAAWDVLGGAVDSGIHQSGDTSLNTLGVVGGDPREASLRSNRVAYIYIWTVKNPSAMQET